jgi:hypothetical protein
LQLFDWFSVSSERTPRQKGNTETVHQQHHACVDAEFLVDGIIPKDTAFQNEINHKTMQVWLGAMSVPKLTGVGVCVWGGGLTSCSLAVFCRERELNNIYENANNDPSMFGLTFS